MVEQFLAGAEVEWHRRGVRHYRQGAGLVLTEHEATADRVVVALADLAALVVLGSEAHAVGMERQPLAAVQDDVLVHVEGDVPAAGQAQPPSLPYLVYQWAGRRRVYRFWHRPGEPEHDRLDAAVPVPGGTERAEQLHPDTGHPVHHAVGGQ